MREIIQLLRSSKQEAPAYLWTSSARGWEEGRARSEKVMSQSEEKSLSQAPHPTYLPPLVGLSGGV